MLEWIEKIADIVSEAVNGVLGPTAEFLEKYVWLWPEKAPLLAVVLLGTGLFVTVRLMFIQVKGFKHAVDIARGKYDNPNDAGDLKHYQALTTALSATVGIGNIAGVALGIRMGGPGALFWMWLTAFFGMALKYAECTLALKFRKVHRDGSVSGGPMYYIEKGLGPKWKWMALLFAGCAAICSFGSGCMNQSNTLATRLETQFGIPTVWSALVFAALVALVIIGGIRRIGRVTSILAPVMAILYVSGALVIIFMYYKQIPDTFALIVRQAFAPEPIAGGAAGSFLMTLMWGIRRGLFSNEAGQGSAPIAHATAKTDEPVREGLVASLGPFIDTLVICTMTGLVIVMSGAYKDRVPQTIGLDDSDLEVIQVEEPTFVLNDYPAIEVADGKPVGVEFTYFDVSVTEPVIIDEAGGNWNGSLWLDPEGDLVSPEGTEPPVLTCQAVLTGADLTAYSFSKELGELGKFIVTLAVVLFAVSTGISWSYYGDRSVEYLFGPRAIKIYRWVFVFFFFMGGILPLSAVWIWGDVALGIMSFPNLIALVLLAGAVASMTREYYSREHKPYKK